MKQQLHVCVVSRINSSPPPPNPPCPTDMDAAHHRHWPGVLKVIAGCHISLFQMPLPEDAVQLGGSMSLHGNHMTLACFHGPNFRSKSWALFHLEEPNIAFWTEAQKIWEDGERERARSCGGNVGILGRLITALHRVSCRHQR